MVMMRSASGLNPHRLHLAPRILIGTALAIVVGIVAVVSVYQSPDSASAAPPAQDATPIATPTATYEPTPTPTESPADLELAAQLARGGKNDGAEGALLAVVARGSPAERLTARIALAKVYQNRASYAQAIRQLRAYLLEAPANADVRDAQFMLARALSATGQDAAALPLYTTYVQGGGSALAYARIGLAESLAATGQTAQALAEANAVPAQDLPRSVRAAFDLQMGLALESASPADAIAWYGRLRSDSQTDADQALAIWRSAVLGTSVSDQFAAWQNVLTNYPDTPTAREIVDTPPPVSAPAPLIGFYERGRVYYYAGENDRARVAFEQAIANGEDGAGAAFYLGALDERDGLERDAIAHYSRVTQIDPSSALADDGLWWQGRLLEQAGRTSDASAAYQQIATSYGSSKFADDARFRAGLVLYDSGNYSEAAKAFDAIATAAKDEVRQRALLWQGKALMSARQAGAARAVFETLRAEAPDEYYGLRAAVLLGEGVGSVRASPLGPVVAPDWAALETWLNGQSPGQPLLARQALFANPHWSAGSALLSLGMTRQAGAEFAVLLDQASRNPALLLELARHFEGAGLTDLSSRAAARLLAQLPDAQRATAPADLWRLAYPVPFGDAANSAAAAEGVPAVLLFALVRQESFFDPLAGSTAGALGLTQVVPATGDEIAQDFKIAAFDPARLFEPDVSLLFGAHYLSQQLDTFDGDIYEALAAYNAGPGSALRWQQAAGGDVDRFVAEIEYDQTELYVRLVTENLARYRQLYQGLAEPSLPKD
jgi:soluble lytic murein transglycosylase